MDESNETAEVVPSLRDRARRYVTAFLAGLGVSAGVGLIIGFVKGGSIWNASGYTVMLLGVVMLLVGGVAAGGHSHLSAGSTVEAFEKRGVRSENRHLDESETIQQPGPAKPTEKGRPAEPHPDAFWEVVGGILSSRSPTSCS